MADSVSLFEVLTTLQRAAARDLADAFAEDGCTVDQWRVLRGLADGQGHRVGELAAELVIPLASMTRLIDALTGLGLVFRRPAQHDRRSVELHLSRQGRERLARLDALAESCLLRLQDHPDRLALRDLATRGDGPAR